MSEKELLTEIWKEIKLLREEQSGNSRAVYSTAEACKYLQIKDSRILTSFYKDGSLPSRYGAQKSGYKYLKSEIHNLQTALLTGVIKLPKR